MKCSNCGTESNSKFCPECGAPMGNPTIPPQQPESNDSAPPPPDFSTPQNGSQNGESEFKYNYTAPTPSRPIPTTEKWYQKTWVIILFIIFIWPVGLFLMWKYKKGWNKIVKIVVTVLIIACALYSCGNMGSDDDSLDQTSSTANVDEKTQDEEPEEESPELQSISAIYTGSTDAGTVLDADNSGIEVTATYDDSSTSSVTDFTIESPATLAAEQTSTVTIKYEDQACDLTVTCTTLSPDTYKAQCQDIAYSELARTPDTYVGQYIKFTGKIIQVQESGNNATYRINVTQGSYGIWDDTIIASFDLSNSSSRFLEDDIVTLYGQYAGLYTYTSVLGAEITIPSMMIEYMDLAQ